VTSGSQSRRATRLRYTPERPLICYAGSAVETSIGLYPFGQGSTSKVRAVRSAMLPPSRLSMVRLQAGRDWPTLRRLPFGNLQCLAEGAGLEPATFRLTAGRSTIELHLKKLATNKNGCAVTPKGSRYFYPVSVFYTDAALQVSSADFPSPYDYSLVCSSP
jgi:hypothetical protein